MQWSERIGRRIKLRDLHVLLAVAQAGSMARAAERLAISHPVISKTIGDLERALGVRLLDRNPQGVELTGYGRALMKCGTAVFDDLRRGVQEIEMLSDPEAGEIRIGSTGPLMEGLIPATVERVTARYPRITVHALEGDGPSLCQKLRERLLDLVVVRTPGRNGNEDLEGEFLFEEQMFVIAGRSNRWARRRRIEVSELLNEPWVLPEQDNFLGELIIESFRSAGLSFPNTRAISGSMAVRTRLAESGRYLTLLPGSMLHFGYDRHTLKILPVALPMKSQAVEMIYLKNKTPNAIASLFLRELRSVARPLLNGRKPSST